MIPKQARRPRRMLRYYTLSTLYCPFDLFIAYSAIALALVSSSVLVSSNKLTQHIKRQSHCVCGDLHLVTVELVIPPVKHCSDGVLGDGECHIL